ncbi:MAG TPA: hypothetical protein VMF12_11835 [Xanthobacteraceae bacterium]|nr:hypothetical protein [Xanthobacteraceae bacterium]
MKPSVAKLSIAMALALTAGAAGITKASAQAMQSPSPCDGFIPLRDDAKQKAELIMAAEKRHADPKELCTIVSRFYIAEGAALKFLESNKTWCGIPEQAITGAKATHEKTLRFRDMVCNAGAQRRVPTLSDAIGVPTLDTAKNTKTNTGTFNTLTGNPLAK